MRNIQMWLMASRERVLVALSLLVALIVWIGYKIYKKMKGGKNEVDENGNVKPIGNAPEGFKAITALYGKQYAQDIERAIIHETSAGNPVTLNGVQTRGYKSGQWLKCGTAGMECSPRDNTKFPFGWGKTLTGFCAVNGLTENDFSTRLFNDAHTGVPTHYIVFKRTGDFVKFMAWHIKTNRGGHIGKWNSLVQSKADHYLTLIKKIQPVFTK